MPASEEEQNWLARRFEDHRTHLQSVAVRMLGSPSEADDAVQECWLRLSLSGDTDRIENMEGWLTTVVARVCVDILRSRRARREEPLDARALEPAASRCGGVDPEQEVVLADSLGPALLAVLDTLAPAERLAFVLHDMFAVPFDEIAPIVGRTSTAARQLASRARRRVHGRSAVTSTELAHQRELVDAFLAAVRDGDFDALVSVLAPDVVARADRTTVRRGGRAEISGPRSVAKGALIFSDLSRFAEPALVDGSAGLVVAVDGRLIRVLRIAVRSGRIAAIDVIADPGHLRRLDLAVFND